MILQFVVRAIRLDDLAVACIQPAQPSPASHYVQASGAQRLDDEVPINASEVDQRVW